MLLVVGLHNAQSQTSTPPSGVPATPPAGGPPAGGPPAGGLNGSPENPSVTATTACNSTARSTPDVVKSVNDFLGTLSSSQKTSVQLDLNQTNAWKWTNFPATAFARQGLSYGSLTSDQVTAVLKVEATALSANGCNLIEEIRKADDILKQTEPQTFSSGNYFIAVLGTPSDTSPWMLQLTGHHIAYNFVYNGPSVSGTPMFDGVEPLSWTDTSGTTHAPLETQRVAVQALAQDIQSNPTLKTAATLSGTFTDVVNGANNASYDGPQTYPTTGRGLQVATLSSAEKQLVKNVIDAWVKNVPEYISRPLLDAYENDAALNSTYVGLGLTSAGTADFSQNPQGLASENSYIRIDGPRVWIEFVVQPGATIKTNVHYHTVWRDKTADYGNEFQQ